MKRPPMKAASKAFLTVLAANTVLLANATESLPPPKHPAPIDRPSAGPGSRSEILITSLSKKGLLMRKRLSTLATTPSKPKVPTNASRGLLNCSIPDEASVISKIQIYTDDEHGLNKYIHVENRDKTTPPWEERITIGEGIINFIPLSSAGQRYRVLEGTPNIGLRHSEDIGI